MIASYYCVVAKTFPFTYETKRIVGFYQTQETAKKVANFVRELNIQELAGGIDVGVETYRGELVKCPLGFRLKEIPQGCVTIIKTNLDREEYFRLLEMKFS